MAIYIYLVLFCIYLTNVVSLVSYDGYRTFRIKIYDDDEFYFMKALVETHPQYDVWKQAHKHGDYMDVMVPPAEIDYFKVTIEHKMLMYHTMLEDVGQWLKAQSEDRESRPKQSYYDFTIYHPLSEIERYIDDLQANFSSHVTVFELGTSYEGRAIRGVKISSGDSNKPAVWLDSCIHAREWIACATTQYFVYKLLNTYETDEEVRDLFDNIDIYYVPVVNVDGYEYTWTDDRLWRKTRSPNEGSLCVGTDPNRNWDFYWCEQGSSTLPCSDAYCGSNAFSESEVRDTANYIQSIDNLQMFLSYHAYGQWYMTPWAHFATPPDNYDEQLTVCNRSISALMAANGGTVTFECGTIQSFVGRTSGSSADWVFDAIDTVKYSFGIELRDKGRYGFELPADQIIPSGEENYAAILELLRTIRIENP